MSNVLIPINFDGEQPTVSARDLHAGLGISERFQSWFNRQLQYGFQESTDYVGCKEFNTLARQELQDYEISVDMAKQICTIQRSEKGRQYRQYFIDLEKAWNTPEQVLARALKIADKEIEKLKSSNTALLEDVQRMKPKETFADAVAASHTSILIGELAKILKQNGVETGQRRLFTWMRDNGYLRAFCWCGMNCKEVMIKILKSQLILDVHYQPVQSGFLSDHHLFLHIHPADR